MHLHKLTFNNIKKEWLILKQGRSKAPFAPLNRNLITVPGMAGAYLSSTEIEPMIITQPVAFFVNNDIKSLELKDELASWLYTEGPVPLQFDDEPGRIYYAVVQNTISDFEKFSNLRQGTIEFLVLDGYSYGPEKEIEFPTDLVSIENKGTAESDPIFELTATQKTTFAMVANANDEYNLIGKPTTVTEDIVDTRTILFEEDGSSLSSWTSSGVKIDGGDVSGSFGTDGAGITVPNYGSGNHWHGPALMKEIDAVQDFEVKAHLQMRTTDVSQTARIEVYLYDENMNVLGKMGVMDNMTTQYVKKGEARYGPFVGRHQNYLISSANYDYNWDYFFGMLRIRRIGNEFEFYITRIAENSDHVFSLKESYIDANNEHAGKLKYVQIHIGKYGTNPDPYSTKFFTVSAYELSEATEDQTPYILNVGDKVIFDHKNDDILVNGEPRNDLKNFGGSFFKLDRGFNNIVISPENTFETKLKFRERFR